MPSNTPTSQEKSEAQRQAEESSFRNEAAMRIMGLSEENERLRRQATSNRRRRSGIATQMLSGLAKLGSKAK